MIFFRLKDKIILAFTLPCSIFYIFFPESGIIILYWSVKFTSPKHVSWCCCFSLNFAYTESSHVASDVPGLLKSLQTWSFYITSVNDTSLKQCSVARKSSFSARKSEWDTETGLFIPLLSQKTSCHRLQNYRYIFANFIINKVPRQRNFALITDKSKPIF